MMTQMMYVQTDNQYLMKKITRDRSPEDIVLANGLKKHQMVIKRDMTEGNVV